MKINEKTASNKSLDRRTRSRCGEWARPGGGLMPTQASPWARAAFQFMNCVYPIRGVLPHLTRTYQHPVPR